jgi:integrase
MWTATGNQQPGPILGRKRSRHHDLPPRMAQQGERFYYVCNGKPRRWIPLGKDRDYANREWARLERRHNSPPMQVGELLHRYIDLREKAGELAKNSVRQYRSYASTLESEFPMPAAELTAQHVALFRDLNVRRKAYMNGCIALLGGAYKKAAEWGVCQHNPGRVEEFELASRDRKITDDEFRAIRAKAVDWLQVAMTIGYLTAARPVDVRSLRWEDCTAEGIRWRLIKTLVRQRFTMTPELSDVLAKARSRPVVGLYVVADRKGRAISKDALEKAMREACEAAGVGDTTFRDIRAQAATDAEELGQDAQALLGHASKAMTERYLRARRTINVDPVRKKL